MAQRYIERGQLVVGVGRGDGEDSERRQGGGGCIGGVSQPTGDAVGDERRAEDQRDHGQRGERPAPASRAGGRGTSLGALLGAASASIIAVSFAGPARTPSPTMRQAEEECSMRGGAANGERRRSTQKSRSSRHNAELLADARVRVTLEQLRPNVAVTADNLRSARPDLLLLDVVPFRNDADLLLDHLEADEDMRGLPVLLALRRRPDLPKRWPSATPTPFATSWRSPSRSTSCSTGWVGC